MGSKPGKGGGGGRGDPPRGGLVGNIWPLISTDGDFILDTGERFSACRGGEASRPLISVLRYLHF